MQSAKRTAEFKMSVHAMIQSSFLGRDCKLRPVPSDESLGYPQSSAYAYLANYFLCKADSINE
jgi:hypothetical protein